MTSHICLSFFSCLEGTCQQYHPSNKLHTAFDCPTSHLCMEEQEMVFPQWTTIWNWQKWSLRRLWMALTISASGVSFIVTRLNSKHCDPLVTLRYPFFFSYPTTKTQQKSMGNALPVKTFVHWKTIPTPFSLLCPPPNGEMYICRWYMILTATFPYLPLTFFQPYNVN